MRRSYHFEDSCNAVKARRKRKPKHWRKALSVRVQKQQRLSTTLEKTQDVTAALLDGWLHNLHSGGTNNSTTLAGIGLVIDRLAQAKPFTKRSVFVDFGSGAGIVCVYVARRFGCRSLGVEKDPRLVEVAVENAKQAGVADLCEFICANFASLGKDWVTEQRVSHVFTFDGVFRADTWNHLFYSIICGAEIVGASVARYAHNWPSCLVKVGESTGSVRLASSTSSFCFAIWQLVESVLNPYQ